MTPAAYLRIRRRALRSSLMISGLLVIQVLRVVSVW
jgi:hypothetical protein